MTIPSTSPKKQSLMPSSTLRRKLRGAGHSLRALVQIGKDGTTPAVLKQLDVVLLDHELVKVKILAECPEDRHEVAAILAKQPKLQVAQILGRTVLAYRKHPEHPTFEK
jgi:RNA-binding protein